jgi:hypothetical protein
MTYSKAKMKSNDDKTSCFKPFWIGKISDKCLPIWKYYIHTIMHQMISYVCEILAPDEITYINNELEVNYVPAQI